jgi:hypothetical protein
VGKGESQTTYNSINVFGNHRFQICFYLFLFDVAYNTTIAMITQLSWNTHTVSSWMSGQIMTMSLIGCRVAPSLLFVYSRILL